MKRRSFLKFLGIFSTAPMVAKAAEKLPEIEETPEEPAICCDFIEDDYQDYGGLGCTCVSPPISFKKIKRTIK
jgi:hypothetical protein